MKKIIVLFFAAVTICSLTARSQESLQGDTLLIKLEKARDLLMEGKKADLSEICLNIMRSHPDNKMAVQWWVIANMERSPEGEQKMESRLDSLSRIYPSNTGILFFKTFLQAEFGKNEEALSGFEKLIGQQPDSSVNYVGKGQVLYEMKKYPEALESFEKAISLDPKRFDLYGMKGSALARLGKFDEAVLTMDEGIELNPGFAPNYYNRACLFSLKGDKKKALADLGKAISMNPRFKQSAVNDEDFKNLYEDEEFKLLTK